MQATLASVLIYTKKVEEMAEFYSSHFNFEMHATHDDRLVE